MSGTDSSTSDLQVKKAVFLGVFLLQSYKIKVAERFRIRLLYFVDSTEPTWNQNELERREEEMNRLANILIEDYLLKKSRGHFVKKDLPPWPDEIQD